MEPQLTEDQIIALKPYDDKLRRSAAGQSIMLTSVATRALKAIFKAVFSQAPSLRSCCSGGRSLSQQLAPLARLYVSTVDAPTQEATPTPAKRGRKPKVQAGV